MNLFNKAFCRIFQYCFKVAIPILPYYNPTILDSVEGLGPTRKKRLLTLYHSIDEIKKASVEQLSQILPKNVAIKLLETLNEK